MTLATLTTLVRRFSLVPGV
ncbi:hypothetical protein AB3Y40_13365 [Yoonia sp. R2331]